MDARLDWYLTWLAHGKPVRVNGERCYLVEGALALSTMQQGFMMVSSSPSAQLIPEPAMAESGTIHEIKLLNVSLEDIKID